MDDILVLERKYAVLLGVFLCLLFTTFGWLCSSTAPLLFRYFSRKKKEKELPLKKRIEVLESSLQLQSQKITELQNTINSVFLSNKRR